jgi:hypothetical protein
LLRLGVQPEDVHVVDVPYTASPIVADALQSTLRVPAENVHRHAYCHAMDYSEYQRDRVARVLLPLLQKDDKPVVVLDDGCYALDALSTMSGPPDLPRRLAIVEQTAR